MVGSAGTDDKVAWLKDELCLDAAFNYRTAKSMDAALAEHCAEGIDIDFENVGGETLQAALDHIRPTAASSCAAPSPRTTSPAPA